jgi:hypothetical protein
MSIDSWIDIWKHASLCNLSDKLLGYTELYTARDLIKALYHFGFTYELNHSYPIMLQGNFLWGGRSAFDLNVEVRRFLKNIIVIDKILNVGNGKLSLCGGSVVSIIGKLLGGNNGISDYDIFFHCNAEEANSIMDQCVNIISEYFDYTSDYNRNFTPVNIRNQKVITFSTPYIKIQFITKLYQNKNRILLGFDMPGCQFGYNPKDSLFMTLQGLIAFVTRSYPVDLTQRCNAYESRLAKYYKKGYSIILPGLGGDWESFQNKKMTFDKSHINNTYTIKIQGNSLDPSGYEPNNGTILGLVQSPLYFNFYSKTPQGLFILDDDDITLTLNRTIGYQYYKYQDQYTHGDESSIKLSNNFCMNNDNAEKFLGKENYEIVQTCSRDSEKFKLFWTWAQIQWKSKAYELASIVNSSKWELDDTASQDFGKFNPVPAEHNEWYGGRYKSVLIGIGYNEFQAFMDCRKNISYIASLPQELFRIICQCWFDAEVHEAMTHIKHLFALGNF